MLREYVSGCQSLRTRAWREVEYTGCFKDFHPHAVESCAMAATVSTVGQWLRLYLDELRHVRPLLDGDDLMTLGVKEGPKVGLLLAKLLDARLDGLVESVEDEEELVRRAMSDDSV